MPVTRDDIPVMLYFMGSFALFLFSTDPDVFLKALEKESFGSYWR